MRPLLYLGTVVGHTYHCLPLLVFQHQHVKKGTTEMFLSAVSRGECLSTRSPINLYRSAVESILAEDILVWFGHTTTWDHLKKKYCKTHFRNHCFTTAIGNTHLYLPLTKLRLFTSQVTLITQHTACLPSSLQTSVWEALRHIPVAWRIASIRRPWVLSAVIFLFIECWFKLFYEYIQYFLTY